MNCDVTSEQVRFYQDRGYILIEDFLTPDELEQWREAVSEAVEARESRRLADREAAGSDNYYDNVFVQRINLWQDNDKVRQLMLDERLGRMAAKLAGVDGVRIWHDQALWKQPWGNPTAWHLDNPYWSFYSRHAISIWVALDDATQQNGCLYFLPGSHKDATYDNVGIGENMADLFKVYPQWRKTEPACGAMKAGDCSFHNGLTGHGAGANMTPHWRRAMTCGYMPDGSTFNGQQNILSDKQVEALTVGDVLDDDKQNPLLWKK